MEKFYFFNSFLDTARAIEDEKIRLKYLMAVIEYGLEGKETDDPLIKALMVQTQFTIDRSKEISLSASERGRMGGRPKSEFKPIEKPKKANESKTKQMKANESEEEVEEEDEVEVEEENKKKEKNTKKKFLDFVLLSDDEHEKLIEKFGTNHTNQLIDRLNNYIGSTGKRYKSHYFTILNWSKNETGTTTHSQAELMKERERQRIREEAQEILNHNRNSNANTIQETTYNRRADLQSG